MTKLKIHNFSMSLDGFGAGPHQSHDDPVGVHGKQLPEWLWETQAFRERFAMPGGNAVGLDELLVRDEARTYGAGIMGRNMFGPIRGSWADSEWAGWWGDNPPFYYPVYVLTHHDRQPLRLQGGTIFYFVTGGIHETLDLAQEAAGDKDIRLSGGVATIRQYLAAGLVDEAQSHLLLGSGEVLFGGLEHLSELYEYIGHASSSHAMHFWLGRRLREGPVTTTGPI